MHIEPGIVEGGKMVLGYVTAAGATATVLKLALNTVRSDGIASLAGRTVVATALVFSFFQILPHHPVGISEVHMIMGSTLFLLFGLAPTALGLVLGLLIQSMFFAPLDLPQYGMNITTLLVPLFAMSLLAKRIIPSKTPYKDLKYRQTLALSSAYQGGIVSWVAFWAFYGQGFGAENLAQVVPFGIAYMTVIILEPLVDLAALALAKSFHRFKDSGMFEKRLYQAA